MRDESRLDLYLLHRAALIEHAAPIVGSRHHAEDIVQEAFLRFAQVPADGMLQPASYLYRIVRNLAIDWTRRVAAERLVAMREGTPADLAVDQRSPEQQAAFREELGIVTAALAELPERTRRAFALYRFEGRTLQEIADALGISVGSAHLMVRKALDHCAERLEPRTKRRER
jgi:RNA polymerase sigma-70 factor (ECF subfamily)